VYGLVTEDLWTGAITNVVPSAEPSPGSSTFLTMDGAAGFDNTALTSQRHYIEILDGPQAGLVLDVKEGNGNALSVWGNCGPSGYDLQPGTRVALRVHATLGTMFPGGAGLVAGSDMVMAVTPVQSGGGGVVLMENWFTYNGSNWEDAASLDPGDNVVVYPGQGILLSIGGTPGGTPRDVVFGSGPVCHVKSLPTLVPIQGSTTAIELMGPVWPVEVEENGLFKTVRVVDLGLVQTLEPWLESHAPFPAMV
jgi:hypothetical protein